MTTPAAAQQYLAEHLRRHNGRTVVIFNPLNKPEAELPAIFCFNNGGSPGWLQAVALGADGEFLGSHVCSDEAYMPADLGVIEGSRDDRHADSYRKHFPEGYRMEWVPSEAIRGHEGLEEAIQANSRAQANPQ